MKISNIYTGRSQPVTLYKETKCYYKVVDQDGFILAFHKATLQHWSGYQLHL